PYVPVHFDASV
nr:Chain B, Ribonuclease A [Bos taurus]